jgi:hypothetical protein
MVLAEILVTDHEFSGSSSFDISWFNRVAKVNLAHLFLLLKHTHSPNLRPAIAPCMIAEMELLADRRYGWPI